MMEKITPKKKSSAKRAAIQASKSRKDLVKEMEAASKALQEHDMLGAWEERQFKPPIGSLVSTSSEDGASPAVLISAEPGEGEGAPDTYTLMVYAEDTGEETLITGVGAIYPVPAEVSPLSWQVNNGEVGLEDGTLVVALTLAGNLSMVFLNDDSRKKFSMEAPLISRIHMWAGIIEPASTA